MSPFDPKRARFDGPEYVPARDNIRLTGQIKRVFDLMKDEKWRTLLQIEEATGDPQASISAQLRHLRKARFGSHKVNRHHVGGGLYKYQLIPNTCTCYVGGPMFCEVHREMGISTEVHRTDVLVGEEKHHAPS